MTELKTLKEMDLTLCFRGINPKNDNYVRDLEKASKCMKKELRANAINIIKAMKNGKDSFCLGHMVSPESCGKAVGTYPYRDRDECYILANEPYESTNLDAAVSVLMFLNNITEEDLK